MGRAARRARRARFEQVPFDHPLWVLYSSGTTGLPKAIVQGQGGILLEHLKRCGCTRPAPGGPPLLVHHHRLDDVELPRRRPARRLDDRPLRRQPGPASSLALAERTGVTCFGTSAAFLTGCMKEGVEPAREADLSALRASARPGRRSRRRASTGRTSTSKSDMWLFSTSGGTDLCTAFVGGCPCCRCTPGRSRRAASAPPSRPWTRTAAAHRPGRRARDHRADALDAGLLLERPRRRALPRELLRDLPRRVAPRRLDQDHRARQRRDLRPLRLHDQPAGRAHGHAPSSTAPWRRCRR